MPPKAIVFDLDGTLVDSLADVGNAMNVVLQRYGLDPEPVEAYRARVGWGLRELARRTLPDTLFERTPFETIAGIFRQAYAENPVQDSTPYPGMPELVERLRSNGIPLAVFSNKPDALVKPVVSALFPDLFVWVHGVRDGIAGKPDAAGLMEAFEVLQAEPAQTAFVGDSEVDVQTARNAGCIPVGVSWGYRERSVVEEAGPVFLVDSVDQLDRVLFGMP